MLRILTINSQPAPVITSLSKAGVFDRLCACFAEGMLTSCEEAGNYPCMPDVS